MSYRDSSNYIPTIQRSSPFYADRSGVPYTAVISSDFAARGKKRSSSSASNVGVQECLKLSFCWASLGLICPEGFDMF